MDGLTTLLVGGAIIGGVIGFAIWWSTYDHFNRDED